MEQKETANYNNLLLDNINLPIGITLFSTPSLLNNSHQKACKIQPPPPISFISINRKLYRPKI